MTKKLMTSDRHTDIQTDRQTYILPLVVLSAALQQKIGDILTLGKNYDIPLIFHFFPFHEPFYGKSFINKRVIAHNLISVSL